MSQNDLISIIIPIYNVEEYLENCLNQLINQTYKNIEMICVNDCSPDNSKDIIEKYSKTDSRIKIVNREYNGGLSAARNSGIAVAKGEYIYFMDSDDWIDVNYIKELYDTIKDKDVDFVVNLNALAVSDDSKTKKLYKDDYIKLSNKGFINPALIADKDPWVAWISLYKLDFLKRYNLLFPEGYIHEDVYFHFKAYLYAKQIFVFNGNSSYFYRFRTGSITSSQKDTEITEVKMWQYVYDKLKEEDLLDKHPLKMFKVPRFIMNEDKFKLYKIYINNILDYVKRTIDIYTPYELYVLYSIMSSETFETFSNNRITKDLVMDFIRHKVPMEICIKFIMEYVNV